MSIWDELLEGDSPKRAGAGSGKPEAPAAKPAAVPAQPAPRTRTGDSVFDQLPPAHPITSGGLAAPIKGINLPRKQGPRGRFAKMLDLWRKGTGGEMYVHVKPGGEVVFRRADGKELPTDAVATVGGREVSDVDQLKPNEPIVLVFPGREGKARVWEGRHTRGGRVDMGTRNPVYTGRTLSQLPKTFLGSVAHTTGSMVDFATGGAEWAQPAGQGLADVGQKMQASAQEAMDPRMRNLMRTPGVQMGELGYHFTQMAGSIVPSVGAANVLARVGKATRLFGGEAAAAGTAGIQVGGETKQSLREYPGSGALPGWGAATAAFVASRMGLPGKGLVLGKQGPHVEATEEMLQEYFIETEHRMRGITDSHTAEDYLVAGLGGFMTGGVLNVTPTAGMLSRGLDPQEYAKWLAVQMEPGLRNIAAAHKMGTQLGEEPPVEPAAPSADGKPSKPKGPKPRPTGPTQEEVDREALKQMQAFEHAGHMAAGMEPDKIDRMTQEEFDQYFKDMAPHLPLAPRKMLVKFLGGHARERLPHRDIPDTEGEPTDPGQPQQPQQGDQQQPQQGETVSTATPVQGKVPRRRQHEVAVLEFAKQGARRLGREEPTAKELLVKHTQMENMRGATTFDILESVARGTPREGGEVDQSVFWDDLVLGNLLNEKDVRTESDPAQFGDLGNISGAGLGAVTGEAPVLIESVNSRLLRRLGRLPSPGKETYDNLLDNLRNSSQNLRSTVEATRNKYPNPLGQTEAAGEWASDLPAVFETEGPQDESLPMFTALMQNQKAALRDFVLAVEKAVSRIVQVAMVESKAKLHPQVRDDMRQMAEADDLEALGGLLIQTVRGNYPNLVAIANELEQDVQGFRDMPPGWLIDATVGGTVGWAAEALKKWSQDAKDRGTDYDKEKAKVEKQIEEHEKTLEAIDPASPTFTEEITAFTEERDRLKGRLQEIEEGAKRKAESAKKKPKKAKPKKPSKSDEAKARKFRDAWEQPDPLSVILVANSAYDRLVELVVRHRDGTKPERIELAKSIEVLKDDLRKHVKNIRERGFELSPEYDTLEDSWLLDPEQDAGHQLHLLKDQAEDIANNFGNKLAAIKRGEDTPDAWWNKNLKRREDDGTYKPEQWPEINEKIREAQEGKEEAKEEPAAKPAKKPVKKPAKKPAKKPKKEEKPDEEKISAEEAEKRVDEEIARLKAELDALDAGEGGREEMSDGERDSEKERRKARLREKIRELQELKEELAKRKAEKAEKAESEEQKEAEEEQAEEDDADEQLGEGYTRDQKPLWIAVLDSYAAERGWDLDDLFTNKDWHLMGEAIDAYAFGEGFAPLEDVGEIARNFVKGAILDEGGEIAGEGTESRNYILQNSPKLMKELLARGFGEYGNFGNSPQEYAESLKKFDDFMGAMIRYYDQKRIEKEQEEDPDRASKETWESYEAEGHMEVSGVPMLAIYDEKGKDVPFEDWTDEMKRLDNLRALMVEHIVKKEEFATEYYGQDPIFGHLSEWAKAGLLWRLTHWPGAKKAREEYIDLYENLLPQMQGATKAMMKEGQDFKHPDDLASALLGARLTYYANDILLLAEEDKDRVPPFTFAILLNAEAYPDGTDIGVKADPVAQFDATTAELAERDAKRRRAGMTLVEDQTQADDIIDGDTIPKEDGKPYYYDAIKSRTGGLEGDAWSEYLDAWRDFIREKENAGEEIDWFNNVLGSADMHDIHFGNVQQLYERIVEGDRKLGGGMLETLDDILTAYMESDDYGNAMMGLEDNRNKEDRGEIALRTAIALEEALHDGINLGYDEAFKGVEPDARDEKYQTYHDFHHYTLSNTPLNQFTYPGQQEQMSKYFDVEFLDYLTALPFVPGAVTSRNADDWKNAVRWYIALEQRYPQVPGGKNMDIATGVTEMRVWFKKSGKNFTKSGRGADYLREKIIEVLHQRNWKSSTMVGERFKIMPATWVDAYQEVGQSIRDGDLGLLEGTITKEEENKTPARTLGKMYFDLIKPDFQSLFPEHEGDDLMASIFYGYRLRRELKSEFPRFFKEHKVIRILEGVKYLNPGDTFARPEFDPKTAPEQEQAEETEEDSDDDGEDGGGGSAPSGGGDGGGPDGGAPAGGAADAQGEGQDAEGTTEEGEGEGSEGTEEGDEGAVEENEFFDPMKESTMSVDPDFDPNFRIRMPKALEMPKHESRYTKKDNKLIQLAEEVYADLKDKDEFYHWPGHRKALDEIRALDQEATEIARADGLRIHTITTFEMANEDKSLEGQNRDWLAGVLLRNRILVAIAKDEDVKKGDFKSALGMANVDVREFSPNSATQVIRKEDSETSDDLTDYSKKGRMYMHGLNIVLYPKQSDFPIKEGDRKKRHNEVVNLIEEQYEAMLNDPLAMEWPGAEAAKEEFDNAVDDVLAEEIQAFISKDSWDDTDMRANPPELLKARLYRRVYFNLHGQKRLNFNFGIAIDGDLTNNVSQAELNEQKSTVPKVEFRGTIIPKPNIGKPVFFYTTTSGKVQKKKDDIHQEIARENFEKIWDNAVQGNDPELFHWPGYRAAQAEINQISFYLSQDHFEFPMTGVASGKAREQHPKPEDRDARSRVIPRLIELRIALRMQREQPQLGKKGKKRTGNDRNWWINIASVGSEFDFTNDVTVDSNTDVDHSAPGTIRLLTFPRSDLTKKDGKEFESLREMTQEEKDSHNILLNKMHNQLSHMTTFSDEADIFEWNGLESALEEIERLENSLYSDMADEGVPMKLAGDRKAYMEDVGEDLDKVVTHLVTLRLREAMLSRHHVDLSHQGIPDYYSFSTPNLEASLQPNTSLPRDRYGQVIRDPMSGKLPPTNNEDEAPFKKLDEWFYMPKLDPKGRMSRHVHDLKPRQNVSVYVKRKGKSDTTGAREASKRVENALAHWNPEVPYTRKQKLLDWPGFDEAVAELRAWKKTRPPVMAIPLQFIGGNLGTTTQIMQQQVDNISNRWYDTETDIGRQIVANMLIQKRAYSLLRIEDFDKPEEIELINVSVWAKPHENMGDDTNTEDRSINYDKPTAEGKMIIDTKFPTVTIVRDPFWNEERVDVHLEAEATKEVRRLLKENPVVPGTGGMRLLDWTGPSSASEEINLWLHGKPRGKDQAWDHKHLYSDSNLSLNRYSDSTFAAFHRLRNRSAVLRDEATYSDVNDQQYDAVRATKLVQLRLAKLLPQQMFRATMGTYGWFANVAARPPDTKLDAAPHLRGKRFSIHGGHHGDRRFYDGRRIEIKEVHVLDQHPSDRKSGALGSTFSSSTAEELKDRLSRFVEGFVRARLEEADVRSFTNMEKVEDELPHRGFDILLQKFPEFFKDEKTRQRRLWATAHASKVASDMMNSLSDDYAYTRSIASKKEKEMLAYHFNPVYVLADFDTEHLDTRGTKVRGLQIDRALDKPDGLTGRGTVSEGGHVIGSTFGLYNDSEIAEDGGRGLGRGDMTYKQKRDGEHTRLTGSYAPGYFTYLSGERYQDEAFEMETRMDPGHPENYTVDEISEITEFTKEFAEFMGESVGIYIDNGATSENYARGTNKVMAASFNPMGHGIDLPSLLLGGNAYGFMETRAEAQYPHNAKAAPKGHVVRFMKRRAAAYYEWKETQADKSDIPHSDEAEVGRKYESRWPEYVLKSLAASPNDVVRFNNGGSHPSFVGGDYRLRVFRDPPEQVESGVLKYRDEVEGGRIKEQDADNLILVVDRRQRRVFTAELVSMTKEDAPSSILPMRDYLKNVQAAEGLDKTPAPGEAGLGNESKYFFNRRLYVRELELVGKENMMFMGEHIDARDTNAATPEEHPEVDLETFHIEKRPVEVIQLNVDPDGQVVDNSRYEIYTYADMKSMDHTQYYDEARFPAKTPDGIQELERLADEEHAKYGKPDFHLRKTMHFRQGMPNDMPLEVLRYMKPQQWDIQASVYDHGTIGRDDSVFTFIRELNRAEPGKNWYEARITYKVAGKLETETPEYDGFSYFSSNMDAAIQAARNELDRRERQYEKDLPYDSGDPHMGKNHEVPEDSDGVYYVTLKEKGWMVNYSRDRFDGGSRQEEKFRYSGVVTGFRKMAEHRDTSGTKNSRPAMKDGNFITRAIPKESALGWTGRARKGKKGSMNIVLGTMDPNIKPTARDVDKPDESQGAQLHGLAIPEKASEVMLYYLNQMTPEEVGSLKWLLEDLTAGANPLHVTDEQRADLSEFIAWAEGQQGLDFNQKDGLVELLANIRASLGEDGGSDGAQPLMKAIKQGPGGVAKGYSARSRTRRLIGAARRAIKSRGGISAWVRPGRNIPPPPAGGGAASPPSGGPPASGAPPPAPPSGGGGGQGRPPNAPGNVPGFAQQPVPEEKPQEGEVTAAEELEADVRAKADLNAGNVVTDERRNAIRRIESLVYGNDYEEMDFAKQIADVEQRMENAWGDKFGESGAEQLRLGRTARGAAVRYAALAHVLSKRIYSEAGSFWEESETPEKFAKALRLAEWIDSHVDFSFDRDADTKGARGLDSDHKFFGMFPSFRAMVLSAWNSKGLPVRSVNPGGALDNMIDSRLAVYPSGLDQDVRDSVVSASNNNSGLTHITGDAVIQTTPLRESWRARGLLAGFVNLVPFSDPTSDVSQRTLQDGAARDENARMTVLANEGQSSASARINNASGNTFAIVKGAGLERSGGSDARVEMIGDIKDTGMASRLTGFTNPLVIEWTTPEDVARSLHEKHKAVGFVRNQAVNVAVNVVKYFMERSRNPTKDVAASTVRKHSMPATLQSDGQENEIWERAKSLLTIWDLAIAEGDTMRLTEKGAVTYAYHLGKYPEVYFYGGDHSRHVVSVFGRNDSELNHHLDTAWVEGLLSRDELPSAEFPNANAYLNQIKTMFNSPEVFMQEQLHRVVGGRSIAVALDIFRALAEMEYANAKNIEDSLRSVANETVMGRTASLSALSRLISQTRGASEYLKASGAVMASLASVANSINRNTSLPVTWERILEKSGADSDGNIYLSGTPLEFNTVFESIEDIKRLGIAGPPARPENMDLASYTQWMADLKQWGDDNLYELGKRIANNPLLDEKHAQALAYFERMNGRYFGSQGIDGAEYFGLESTGDSDAFGNTIYKANLGELTRYFDNDRLAVEIQRLGDTKQPSTTRELALFAVAKRDENGHPALLNSPTLMNASEVEHARTMNEASAGWRIPLGMHRSLRSQVIMPALADLADNFPNLVGQEKDLALEDILAKRMAFFLLGMERPANYQEAVDKFHTAFTNKGMFDSYWEVLNRAAMNANTPFSHLPERMRERLAGDGGGDSRHELFLKQSMEDAKRRIHEIMFPKGGLGKHHISLITSGYVPVNLEESETRNMGENPAARMIRDNVDLETIGEILDTELANYGFESREENIRRMPNNPSFITNDVSLEQMPAKRKLLMKGRVLQTIRYISKVTGLQMIGIALPKTAAGDPEKGAIRQPELAEFTQPSTLPVSEGKSIDEVERTNLFFIPAQPRYVAAYSHDNALWIPHEKFYGYLAHELGHVIDLGLQAGGYYNSEWLSALHLAVMYNVSPQGIAKAIKEYALAGTTLTASANIDRYEKAIDLLRALAGQPVNDQRLRQSKEVVKEILNRVSLEASDYSIVSASIEQSRGTTAQGLTRNTRLPPGTGELQRAYRRTMDIAGDVYLSSPTEMFARLTELYVAHRLEKEGALDLLSTMVHGVDSMGMTDMRENIHLALPKKDEKYRLFEVFERFLENIRNEDGNYYVHDQNKSVLDLWVGDTNKDDFINVANELEDSLNELAKRANISPEKLKRDRGRSKDEIETSHKVRLMSPTEADLEEHGQLAAITKESSPWAEFTNVADAKHHQIDQLTKTIAGVEILLQKIFSNHSKNMLVWKGQNQNSIASTLQIAIATLVRLANSEQVYRGIEDFPLPYFGTGKGEGSFLEYPFNKLNDYVGKTFEARPTDQDTRSNKVDPNIAKHNNDRGNIRPPMIVNPEQQGVGDILSRSVPEIPKEVMDARGFLIPFAQAALVSAGTGFGKTIMALRAMSDFILRDEHLFKTLIYLTHNSFLANQLINDARKDGMPVVSSVASRLNDLLQENPNMDVAEAVTQVSEEMGVWKADVYESAKWAIGDLPGMTDAWNPQTEIAVERYKPTEGKLTKRWARFIIGKTQDEKGAEKQARQALKRLRDAVVEIERRGASDKSLVDRDGKRSLVPTFVVYWKSNTFPDHITRPEAMVVTPKWAKRDSPGSKKWELTDEKPPLKKRQELHDLWDPRPLDMKRNRILIMDKNDLRESTKGDVHGNDRKFYFEHQVMHGMFGYDGMITVDESQSLKGYAEKRSGLFEGLERVGTQFSQWSNPNTRVAGQTVTGPPVGFTKSLIDQKVELTNRLGWLWTKMGKGSNRFAHWLNVGLPSAKKMYMSATPGDSAESLAYAIHALMGGYDKDKRPIDGVANLNEFITKIADGIEPEAAGAEGWRMVTARGTGVSIIPDRSESHLETVEIQTAPAVETFTEELSNFIRSSADSFYDSLELSLEDEYRVKVLNKHGDESQTPFTVSRDEMFAAIKASMNKEIQNAMLQMNMYLNLVSKTDETVARARMALLMGKKPVVQIKQLGDAPLDDQFDELIEASKDKDGKPTFGVGDMHDELNIFTPMQRVLKLFSNPTNFIPASSSITVQTKSEGRTKVTTKSVYGYLDDAQKNRGGTRSNFERTQNQIRTDTKKFFEKHRDLPIEHPMSALVRTFGKQAVGWTVSSKRLYIKENPNDFHLVPTSIGKADRKRDAFQYGRLDENGNPFFERDDIVGKLSALGSPLGALFPEGRPKAGLIVKDKEKQGLAELYDKLKDAPLASEEESTPMMMVISAESGGVGIDLHDIDYHQRTHLVIEFDYNPIPVEQALGRTDRTGQTSKREAFMLTRKNNVMDTRVAMVVSQRAKAVEGTSSGDVDKEKGSSAQLQKMAKPLDKTLHEAAKQVAKSLHIILLTPRLAQRYFGASPPSISELSKMMLVMTSPEGRRFDAILQRILTNNRRGDDPATVRNLVRDFDPFASDGVLGDNEAAVTYYNRVAYLPQHLQDSMFDLLNVAYEEVKRKNQSEMSAFSDDELLRSNVVSSQKIGEMRGDDVMRYILEASRVQEGMSWEDYKKNYGEPRDFAVNDVGEIRMLATTNALGTPHEKRGSPVYVISDGAKDITSVSPNDYRGQADYMQTLDLGGMRKFERIGRMPLEAFIRYLRPLAMRANRRMELEIGAELSETATRMSSLAYTQSPDNPFAMRGGVSYELKAGNATDAEKRNLLNSIKPENFASNGQVIEYIRNATGDARRQITDRILAEYAGFRRENIFNQMELDMSSGQFAGDFLTFWRNTITDKEHHSFTDSDVPDTMKRYIATQRRLFKHAKNAVGLAYDYAQLIGPQEMFTQLDMIRKGIRSDTIDPAVVALSAMGPVHLLFDSDAMAGVSRGNVPDDVDRNRIPMFGYSSQQGWRNAKQQMLDMMGDGLENVDLTQAKLLAAWTNQVNAEAQGYDKDRFEFYDNPLFIHFEMFFSDHYGDGGGIVTNLADERFMQMIDTKRNFKPHEVFEDQEERKAFADFHYKLTSAVTKRPHTEDFYREKADKFLEDLRDVYAQGGRALVLAQGEQLVSALKQRLENGISNNDWLVGLSATFSEYDKENRNTSEVVTDKFYAMQENAPFRMVMNDAEKGRIWDARFGQDRVVTSNVVVLSAGSHTPNLIGTLRQAASNHANVAAFQQNDPFFFHEGQNISSGASKLRSITFRTSDKGLLSGVVVPTELYPTKAQLDAETEMQIPLSEIPDGTRKAQEILRTSYRGMVVEGGNVIMPKRAVARLIDDDEKYEIPPVESNMSVKDVEEFVVISSSVSRRDAIDKFGMHEADFEEMAITGQSVDEEDMARKFSMLQPKSWIGLLLFMSTHRAQPDQEDSVFADLRRRFQVDESVLLQRNMGTKKVTLGSSNSDSESRQRGGL